MKKTLNNLDFRTDLAIECHECYESSEIDGVLITNKLYENSEITKTKVEILNETGEALLGKQVGDYITIEAKKLKDGDVVTHDKVIELFIETLKEIPEFEQAKNILVVGLGNLYVTPDSLGQKVVQKLLITSHFFDSLKNDFKGIRKVSSLAPGVMGQTGIETANIVKSVAKEINADLVIAIDALCARNIDRLNKTIQISNTGISPGSGVNNNRSSLSKSFLGINVLSIGVPTVIDAKMLFKDVLEYSLYEENDHISNLNLSNSVKNDIIHGVLDNSTLDMFISPKEIDELIVRISGIIARGLNRALHYGITDDEITSLLY